jgi:hypothetical protein
MGTISRQGWGWQQGTSHKGGSVSFEAKLLVVQYREALLDSLVVCFASFKPEGARVSFAHFVVSTIDEEPV